MGGTHSSKFWDGIAVLLLLAVGGALVYGNLFQRDFGGLIDKLLQIPWAGAALGMLMVLSVLLRWIGKLGPRKEGFIDFKSGDGTVGISTRAVKDFVERVGGEFSAVKGIDTKLTRTRKELNISLRVKVLAGNQIPELSQMMQQRIRESMRESLGLEQIGGITIRIQEIVGDAVVPPEDFSPLD